MRKTKRFPAGEKLWTMRWALLRATLWILLAAMVLSTSACGFSTDEMLGRRGSPYTAEQAEEILSAAYDQEFTLVSVEETEHQRVVFEFSSSAADGLTFTFTDANDGLAGWSAWDNYPEAVLEYCAQRQGFEPLSSVGNHYGLLLDPDESPEQTAQRFLPVIEDFFAIYHTARQPEGYISYDPPEEHRGVYFRVLTKGADPMSERMLSLEDGTTEGKPAPYGIVEGMTADEVAAAFEWNRFA